MEHLETQEYDCLAVFDVYYKNGKGEFWHKQSL